MHKAKAGGEFGANGEWYKGGQFAADSKDWIKQLGSQKRIAKIEIEPFKFIEVSDREQILSIFEIIKFKCAWGGFPRRPVKLIDYCTYENYDIPFYQEIFSMYLAGERTMTLREYCELAKKHNYTTHRVFRGKTTECSEILKQLKQ